MKIEIPKVTLESNDISRLHNLLGMAWRSNGESMPPDEMTSRAVRDGELYQQYEKLATEVVKAAEVIAQDAFATGVKYSQMNAQE